MSVKVTASDGTASVSDTFDIVVSAAPVVAGLISNIGQTTGTDHTATIFDDVAQRFTTGSNATGYTVTGADVEVRVVSGSVPTYSVKICEVTNSNPGSTCPGTLTNPASLTTGTNTFTASGDGISLNANTDYFLYLDYQSGGSGTINWRSTGSDAEDTGGAAGWNIRNERRQRSLAGWRDESDSLKIRIKGTANAPDEATITAVAFASDPAWDVDRDGTNDTYHRGADIDVKVTWDRDVTWDTSASGAKIRVRLDIGGTTRTAELVTGGATSGTASSLTFRHTVLAADADTDGLAVTPTKGGDLVILASGATLVAGGENANREHAGLAADANRKVDGSLIGAQPSTPPSAPAAPTVTVASGTSLAVSWSAPTNLGTGTEITDYDLRYFQGTADPANEADWIEEGETNGPPDPGSGTSAVITGLTKGSAYRVQVRAFGDGESPWSASGSATPANRAPRAIKSQAFADGTRCAERAATETDPVSTNNAPFDTLVHLEIQQNGRASGDTAEWPAVCRTDNSNALPWFDDPDGDALTYTASVVDLPDNVRVGSNLPRVQTGRVFYIGIAARTTTDVRVDMTATDPDGEAATTRIAFRTAPSGDTNGAPSFSGTVAAQSYTAGRTIAALQLPVATGGDLGLWDHDGDIETDEVNAFDYEYAVSGLPAGLSFDAETRQVTGRASETGTFTVTYTAEDADFDVTDSDRASLSFDVAVAENTAGLPEPLAATVNGGILQVHFSKDLDSGSTPATSAFDVKSGSTAVSVSSVTVAGRSVTLSLGSVFSQTDTGTVAYAAPAANPLQDAGGNAAASFAAQTLTNTNPMNNPGKPVLSTAAVNGETLTLTYDKALNPTAVPQATAFTVKGAGADQNPTAVSVAGSAATLTLGTAASPGDTVTVSYSKATAPRFQNLWGTQADALTDQAVTNDTPDTTAPVLSSATVEGTTLTLTYGEALDGNSTPAASAYAVSVAGASRTVSTVSVAGSAVTLTLASAVSPGETVTVSYTVPSTNPVQDSAGNDAAALSSQAVTHVDTTAPVLSTAVVGGTALTLTYNETLDGDSVPAASAYTVKVGGTAVSLAATDPVAVSGSAVTLTLASAVTSGDTVTVSYAVPTTNPVQDAAGNDAAVLTDQAVTHVDTAPTPSSAAATDARTLTLTFDKAVTVPPADPNHVNPGQKKKGKFPLEDLRYVFSIQGLYSEGRQIPNVSPHRVRVSGSTVTLTLADAVEALPGREVTVSYVATNAAGEHNEHATLQDASGNKVADFTQTATLQVMGHVTPVLEVAAVSGTRLALQFDGNLNGGPAGSRFRVHYDDSFYPGLGGTVVYGTGTATVSGFHVIVTLAEAVPQDRFAAVSYTAGDDADPLRGPSDTSNPGSVGPKVGDIRGFFPVNVHDRTVPTLVSATLAGTKLVLTYDEPLDTGSTPATTDFAVSLGSGTRTVSGVTVNASAVTLTLSGTAVPSGVSGNISYTAGTNKIQDDTADNPNAAANLTNQTVTNLGPTDPGKPALASADPASAAGPELTLTFTRDLDPAHVPAASAFTLSAGREVSGIIAEHAGQDAVTVRGNQVVLAMSPSWYPCDDTITVSYAKPSSNALRNVWGTEADAFSGQAVRNAWNAECDGTAPRHGTLRVVREGAGGSGAVGLQFDKALQRERTPDPDDFTVTSKNGAGGNGGSGNGGAGAQATSGTGGGGPIGIRTVQFTQDAHGLSLGLSRALGVGERITLTYRRKAGSPGLWTAGRRPGGRLHGGGRGVRRGGAGGDRRGGGVRRGRRRHLRPRADDPGGGDLRRGGGGHGRAGALDRHGPGGLGREARGLRERERHGDAHLRPQGGGAERFDAGHRGAGELAAIERRDDPLGVGRNGRGPRPWGPRPRCRSQGGLDPVVQPGSGGRRGVEQLRGLRRAGQRAARRAGDQGLSRDVQRPRRRRTDLHGGAVRPRPGGAGGDAPRPDRGGTGGDPASYRGRAAGVLPGRLGGRLGRHGPGGARPGGDRGDGDGDRPRGPLGLGGGRLPDPLGCARGRVGGGGLGRRKRRHLRPGRHRPGGGEVRRPGGGGHGRRDAAAQDRHGPGGLGREVGVLRERERHVGTGVRLRGGGAQLLD